MEVMVERRDAYSDSGCLLFFCGCENDGCPNND